MSALTVVVTLAVFVLGVLAGWLIRAKAATPEAAELARLQAEVAAASALAEERRRGVEAAGSTSQALAGMQHSITQALNTIDQRVSASQSSGVALRETVDNMVRTQASMGTDVGKLSSILSRSDYRGRWGEVALRRLVEAAGMLERVDFTEQATIRSGDTRLQPDMLVHLPEDRQIVVDAKAPLEAIIGEVAPDAPQQFAAAVRRHVDTLSSKQYWAQMERATDFVVMFLPAESLLSTALIADPGILEHAFERRVIPATPTTMLALLRTISIGWRDVKLAEAAGEVQRIGAELYERLRVFSEHLARVGTELNGAVSAYNKAVGSLESRVLVSGRRMSELGVKGQPLADLPIVEGSARAPVTEG